jgi:hypothetical protein
MTLGLDYSAGWPGGRIIRVAGYNFVIRYLDNGLGGGRANLTAAEVADLQANGVDIALVWERKLLSGPDRATQGPAAGAADAGAALAAARAVGLPGRPIYFAVDFDIPDYAPGNADPAAKLGPVRDYFTGIRAVMPAWQVGVYGGFYAVSRVLDANLASWAWQTMAWSGGQVDPRIHLLQRIGEVQVGGVGCDVNEARQSNFGQHTAEATVALTNDDIGLLMQYNVLRPGGDPNHPADYVNVGQALIAALDTRAELDALKAQVAALPAGTGTGGGATKADVTAALTDVLSHLRGDTSFVVVTP